MEKTIRSKVPLDSTMLMKINKFYSSKLTDTILNRECFSNPDLESHLCNLKAPLEGDQKCNYCKHVAGRRCLITCHIHHFCLAVFAYRLGVGGEDLWDAVKQNTEKSGYNNLVTSVSKIVSENAPEKPKCEEAQDLSAVRIEGVETVGDDSPDDVVEGISSGSGSDGEEEYITIVEAASLHGCSYINMITRINGGILEKLEVDGKQVVRKSDVLKLKDDNVKKEEVKVVEKTVKIDIVEAIKGLPTIVPEVNTSDTTESSLEEFKEEVEEEVVAKEYLTIAEAALLYGCQYYNMYNHVKKGNIEKSTVDGRQLLKRVDVLELKRKRSRKKNK